MLAVAYWRGENCGLLGRWATMVTVDAQQLFPGALEEIYDALSARVLGLGDDIAEEFSRTQVSYGAARKFVWLTPVTKTKALLTMDMWDEHHASFLRGVIRFRDDKYTHQIEVRTASDIATVAALGWFKESAAWGRKQR
jgi:predicted transport protein